MASAAGVSERFLRRTSINARLISGTSRRTGAAPFRQRQRQRREDADANPLRHHREQRGRMADFLHHLRLDALLPQRAVDQRSAARRIILQHRAAAV